jgi:G3E family GTPase
VAAWLNVAAFDEHRHDPNRHDARITAFCVTLEDPLGWQGVAMWLEMLVASRGENLLRVKGILNLKGHDRPVAVHAVRHLMHPPVKLTAWPDGDPRTSRLVFITCDLPRAVIEEGLLAFQAANTQAS